MATGSVEYARVERILDHPPEQVWAIIGMFGGLELWADGVTACVVDGEVRTVTRNGATVRERLDRRDPAAYELAYSVLAPHPLPADEVRSTITLTEVAPNRTAIAWRSEARDFRAPAEGVRARIEAFYAASLDGLARLLSAA